MSMPSLEIPVLRALHRARAQRRGRKGMNLIEIMIVVAIIVILIGVLSVAAFQAWESFKASNTKLIISQLGQLTMTHMMLGGNKVPGSIKDVEGVKENMMVDGWGREFEFVAPGPNNEPFDIVSYGRDGSEGGTGLDADIRYSEGK